MIKEITVRLADARMELIQRCLENQDTDSLFLKVLLIQSELRESLRLRSSMLEASEAIILLDICQAFSESLAERNRANDALDIFETEKCILAYSKLADEESTRVSERMNENYKRICAYLASP